MAFTRNELGFRTMKRPRFKKSVSFKCIFTTALRWLAGFFCGCFRVARGERFHIFLAAAGRFKIALVVPRTAFLPMPSWRPTSAALPPDMLGLCTLRSNVVRQSARSASPSTLNWCSAKCRASWLRTHMLSSVFARSLVMDLTFHFQPFKSKWSPSLPVVPGDNDVCSMLLATLHFQPLRKYSMYARPMALRRRP